MITITEANILESQATITAAGTPVDPTTVAFVYILNSDPTTKVTLTYVSATVPAPGVVARTAEGAFTAQVDLTGLAGTLERYWQTTGVGQGTSDPETVIIPALPF